MPDELKDSCPKCNSKALYAGEMMFGGKMWCCAWCTNCDHEVICETKEKMLEEFYKGR